MALDDILHEDRRIEVVEIIDARQFVEREIAEERHAAELQVGVERRVLLQLRIRLAELAEGERTDLDLDSPPRQVGRELPRQELRVGAGHIDVQVLRPKGVDRILPFLDVADFIEKHIGLDRLVLFRKLHHVLMQDALLKKAPTR